MQLEEPEPQEIQDRLAKLAQQELWEQPEQHRLLLVQLGQQVQRLLSLDQLAAQERLAKRVQLEEQEPQEIPAQQEASEVQDLLVKRAQRVQLGLHQSTDMRCPTLRSPGAS